MTMSQPSCQLVIIWKLTLLKMFFGSNTFGQWCQHENVNKLSTLGITSCDTQTPPLPLFEKSNVPSLLVEA